MCRSHNMKMVFKVADKQRSPKPEPQAANVNQINDQLDVKVDQGAVEDKHESGNNKVVSKKKKHNKGSTRSDVQVTQDRDVQPFVEKSPDPVAALDDREPVEDDIRDADVFSREGGEVFGRKEPKSLDYYLYQTRSNSPGTGLGTGFDEPKRNSKSSFKQEASTGGATTISSSKLFQIFLLHLFASAQLLRRQ